MAGKGYLGFVTIETALPITHLCTDGSDIPTNPSSNPTFRVYGAAGVMNNGTGSLTMKDSGSITGATNANPISITSANHGLSTGTRVTITGVGGNTAANTTTTVTSTGTNTFTLDTTAGNGAYTSGGTWNVSGLYGGTFTPSGANGFVQGQTYTVLVSSTVSVNHGDTYTFTVI